MIDPKLENKEAYIAKCIEIYEQFNASPSMLFDRIQELQMYFEAIVLGGIPDGRDRNKAVYDLGGEVLDFMKQKDEEAGVSMLALIDAMFILCKSVKDEKGGLDNDKKDYVM